MFYNIREFMFTYFYCSAGSSCQSNTDFEFGSLDHCFNLIDSNFRGKHFKRLEAMNKDFKEEDNFVFEGNYWDHRGDLGYIECDLQEDNIGLAIPIDLKADSWGIVDLGKWITKEEEGIKSIQELINSFGVLLKIILIVREVGDIVLNFVDFKKKLHYSKVTLFVATDFTVNFDRWFRNKNSSWTLRLLSKCHFL